MLNVERLLKLPELSIYLSAKKNLKRFGMPQLQTYLKIMILWCRLVARSQLKRVLRFTYAMVE